MMKQLRGFLFGIGCVGTIFCVAVGLVGLRQSDPAHWSIIQNAEVQKSYVTNRIINRTMPAKWAPVIEASYVVAGKTMSGTVELGSYDSKSEAEDALASYITNWNGDIYSFKPEPTRLALVLQPKDYYTRILFYGVPFLLLATWSAFSMLKKKTEPNQ